MNQRIIGEYVELKNDRFLRALQGQDVDVTPVWMMRQAGRYLPEYRNTRKQAGDFISLCQNPQLACEVALQPLRRYAFDAAILFSDILTIPDAMGQGLYFSEGEGPKFKKVIRSEQDVDKLPDIKVADDLSYVTDAVSLIRKELNGSVPLIGFSGSPWTLATYMVEGRGGTDHSHTKVWAYLEPDGFGKLIKLLTDAVTIHLLQQIESGADVVKLFDSWAGVLAETQFRRWVIEPTTEIVRRLKLAHPEIRIIGFPRGAGVLYQEYAHATGVDAIAIDGAVPAAWAAETLQRDRTVQGNLDNLALMTGGETLTNETHRILGALGGGPFIFNLGHGVLPKTPPENVTRLATLIREWKA